MSLLSLCKTFLQFSFITSVLSSLFLLLITGGCSANKYSDTGYGIYFRNYPPENVLFSTPMQVFLLLWSPASSHPPDSYQLGGVKANVLSSRLVKPVNWIFRTSAQSCVAHSMCCLPSFTYMSSQMPTIRRTFGKLYIHGGKTQRFLANHRTIKETFLEHSCNQKITFP